MPIISQWYISDPATLVPSQKYDDQFIRYVVSVLPRNEDNGDGRPYLETPFGGTKACFLEQASPYFFPGAQGGYIQAGLVFYGGSLGSTFDMRAMIQSRAQGGFYAMRVISNPDGTIDIAIGATPPGAYGVTKVARLYFNELSSLRAIEGLTDGDLVYVQFGWEVNPPDSDRPRLTLYGGVSLDPADIPAQIQLTYDFDDFPAFVPGGHTPPFDPTTEEILSISPDGLYVLKHSVLEHSIFYGPQEIRVFSYFVKVRGAQIIAEQWEPPTFTPNLITTEQWEETGLEAPHFPEYRPFHGGYRRW